MIFALVVAGGKGTRLGAGMNKAFVCLDDQSMLWHACVSVNNQELIDHIIVVVGEGESARAKIVLEDINKPLTMLEGGMERQDSVYIGLRKAQELGNSKDIVVVHQAANPFVRAPEIGKLIVTAQKKGASTLGYKKNDQVRMVEQGVVGELLPSGRLWTVMGPVAATLGELMNAYEHAFRDGSFGHDDVGLLMREGLSVHMVECSTLNFTVATQEDFKKARGILLAEEH